MMLQDDVSVASLGCDPKFWNTTVRVVIMLRRALPGRPGSFAARNHIADALQLPSRHVSNRSFLPQTHCRSINKRLLYHCSPPALNGWHGGNDMGVPNVNIMQASFYFIQSPLIDNDLCEKLNCIDKGLRKSAISIYIYIYICIRHRALRVLCDRAPNLLSYC